MKKLIFISLFLTANAEAKKIVLDIPDEDIAIVETYVPDAEEWIRQAWAGKVNSRREVIVKEEVEYCLKNGKAVPASQDKIIKQCMKRLGTRKQRDAEFQKAQEKNGR